MSWLFSRALVAEYSAATCSDGERSALLSGNPTPQAYCAPDRMTAFSRLSRFGMTFGILTADRGAELLTLYRGDFPVRTYPAPGEAQESTVNGRECGEKWHGLLARYDRDSCSWKTPQCSLLEDSGEFSGTWPRSGMMRSGTAYLRPTVAHRMEGIDFGLSGERFPTPCARDYKGARSDAALAATGRNQVTNSLPDYLASIGLRGQMVPEFREWLLGWPMGWTGLKPLETARFHEWQRMHSPTSAPVPDGDRPSE